MDFRSAPISSLWAFSSAWLSLAAKNHWAGIRNSQLKMSFRSVMKDGEWQRPLTAVLYHDKVDLQFWVTLFFLYTVASQLERRLFSKKPAAFLTQLVFGLAFITLPGYWIRDLRLPLANEVFGMFLLTWYGIECGTDSVLLGPLPIPAFLVPMAYLGSRYYRSARSLLLLKKLLLGVGAGLLISLMNPNEEKARRLKRERQQKAKKMAQKNDADDSDDEGKTS